MDNITDYLQEQLGGTFPKITSDFFSNGLNIPDNEEYTLVPEKKKTPQDWKHIINRAFMRGFTAKDILNSIGDNIMKMPNSNEVLAYIKKYEGLIGTVFVDSEVIKGGFPYNSIPKKFEPYHRFAINCHDVKREIRRTVEGGEGGGIDDFLNSVDVLVEEAKDFCRLTGLPVLKKGMFNADVISELMATLGMEGSTMAELQEALKKNVLYIKKNPLPVQTETAENYNLKNQAQKVEIKEVAKPVMPVASVKFKKGKAEIQKVDIREAPKAAKIIAYKPKATEDVKINEPAPNTTENYNLKKQTQKVDIREAPKAAKIIAYKPKATEDITFADVEDDFGNLDFDDKMRFDF